MQIFRRAFLAGSAATMGAAVLQRAAANPSPASAGNGKYLLSTHVAGTGYEGRNRVAAQVEPGARLELCRDPANDYDPLTVEVRTKSGDIIGHVPRSDAQALANLMDQGAKAEAVVEAADGNGDRPEIGIRIYLA